jgi:hypothetical protein
LLTAAQTVNWLQPFTNSFHTLEKAINSITLVSDTSLDMTSFIHTVKRFFFKIVFLTILSEKKKDGGRLRVIMIYGRSIRPIEGFDVRISIKKLTHKQFRAQVAVHFDCCFLHHKPSVLGTLSHKPQVHFENLHQNE